jgi:hypothetical protein
MDFMSQIFFVSGRCIPANILPIWGFMTIINFQTLIISFSHCVPIRNTYGFLRRKKPSKFKLSTYYLAEMFAYKIVQYILRKFASQNVF